MTFLCVALQARRLPLESFAHGDDDDGEEEAVVAVALCMAKKKKKKKKKEEKSFSFSSCLFSRAMMAMVSKKKRDSQKKEKMFYLDPLQIKKIKNSALSKFTLSVPRPRRRVVLIVHVIVKQLLPGLQIPRGEDRAPRVPVHHQDLGRAVGVRGVVGEPELAPSAPSVDDGLFGQVEEVRVVVEVVGLPSPVGFAVVDQFPDILPEQVVFFDLLHDEAAPAGDGGAAHREAAVLPEAEAHVAAGLRAAGEGRDGGRGGVW